MVNGSVHTLEDITPEESSNPATTLISWQHSFSRFLRANRKQTKRLLIAINLTYSTLVALEYGSLAAERGENRAWQMLFALSSFAQNFPVAFTFFEGFVDFSKKLLFNGSRRFKVSATLGLFLGITTTIAGIPLSQDAIGKSNFGFIRSLDLFGVILFAFNTLSTRFVGATGLIDGLTDWCGYAAGRCFSQGTNLRGRKLILSEVSQDLDRALFSSTPDSFDISGLELSDPNDIVTAIQAFYQSPNADLSNNRQENSMRNRIWPPTKIALNAIIVSLACLLTPMWLNLTEDGYNVLTHKNHPKQNSATDVGLFVFVWIGALSNLFFSFNTGARFPQTIVNFFLICVTMMGQNASGYTFSAALFLLIAASGYLSGAGIASEIVKYKKNGFGVVAKNLRNSRLSAPQDALEKIIDAETAGTMVAGEFINAGCTLRWVTNVFSSRNHTELEELKSAVTDFKEGRMQGLTHGQLFLIEQASSKSFLQQQQNEMTPLLQSGSSSPNNNSNKSPHATENDAPLQNRTSSV